MASSSTSSIPKSFKYDVFLSFGGEDTRTNFIDHLNHALQQKSIHTFKDDEKIKKGKEIRDELIGSIEASRFYIIVFSKNYASSSWCLDELVKIMECHRTKEHTAYPVFYDVEPSEIRKQTGAVEDAFSKHEKEESAGKWREALKEAADLAGWELKNNVDGHEAKFIQKIVKELSLELRSISFNIDENWVGMKTRIKDVISSLGTDDDDVRMIGIKGMGGAGKTTLARAVYDEMAFEFEGKSFVENVREVSTPSLSGLKSLQTQILSDILNDRNINISSVSDGKHMIKKMMSSRKVLVVLDDVDHIDQLEALAGEPNWFKPGSRIIITTRDEQVLIARRVKLIRDVNLLTNDEAIRLFDRYAFGREGPIQGYKELSTQVVRYAAGLPLTIKVLGSFLCRKSELEWKDAIERLKTIPLEETMKKLELSFIGLNKDCKEIFLDIACILKGWQKEAAIKALESCGLHARIGLRVLEQKSLITTSYNGQVRMHDHIEEMGKDIVRRLHPDEPHKHSRLWIQDEIEEILANDMGTEATRCLKFVITKVNQYFLLKGLKRMKGLRFLHVDYFRDFKDTIVSPEFPNAFPNALRYLHFHDYPFRSLPDTFQARNLVRLEMRGSKIVKLWEGEERKVLNKLRFLDLSRSSKLRTLDLQLAPNLETVKLYGCTFLEELLMPRRCLNLKSLMLSESKLRALDIGFTPNLESLDLDNYSSFEVLHMAGPWLNLTKLEISNSKLRTFDIELTPNLESLILRNCSSFEVLNMAGPCLNLTELEISDSKLRTFDIDLTPNLESLILRNCSSFEVLNMAGPCLNLTELEISDSKLRTFDIDLTPNLESLILRNCSSFEVLHIGSASGKLTELSITHSKLRTLDLGLTPSLRELDLEECCKLEELRIPIGLFKQVVYFHLSGCFGFKNFLFHYDYEEYGLHFIAESLESCSLHPYNNLSELQISCHFIDMCCCKNLEAFLRNIYDQLEILTLEKITYLPDSICVLENLTSLKLESCLLLEKLPEDIGRLECLKKLTLSSTTIKHLPDSICMLKCMQSLKLEFCWLLEKLPEDIGRLECLEELTLSSAKIKRLPDSICMLKNLEYLELGHCLLLEELPSDLGRLESLVTLDLSHTNIKHLPGSICMLKRLYSLTLNHCLLLEELPSDLGRLESLVTLDLSHTNIKHLPGSICMLKRLNSLTLNHCLFLEKLPEELGCLKQLRMLYIKGTSISYLPQSIGLLTGLYIIGSRELLESCGFTSDIKTSPYTTFCSIEVPEMQTPTSGVSSTVLHG